MVPETPAERCYIMIVYQRRKIVWAAIAAGIIIVVWLGLLYLMGMKGVVGA